MQPTVCKQERSESLCVRGDYLADVIECFFGNCRFHAVGLEVDLLRSIPLIYLPAPVCANVCVFLLGFQQMRHILTQKLKYVHLFGVARSSARS